MLHFQNFDVMMIEQRYEIIFWSFYFSNANKLICVGKAIEDSFNFQQNTFLFAFSTIIYINKYKLCVVVIIFFLLHSRKKNLYKLLMARTALSTTKWINWESSTQYYIREIRYSIYKVFCYLFFHVIVEVDWIILLLYSCTWFFLRQLWINDNSIKLK